MLRTTHLLILLILSSLTFACGEGSLEVNGFGSTCFLNDRGSNLPLLHTFSGKVAVGTLTSLSLGECSDVPGEAQIVSAQSSDESVFTVSVQENALQVSALSSGTAILTVSRDGGEDVTFELVSAQADQVKITDPISNTSMVVGSSFETYVQHFLGEEFISGHKSWAEQGVTSEGLTLEDREPGQIKLTATATGEQTLELDSASWTVSVVELSELQFSLQTLISSAEGAFVSILLVDQANRDVISVTEEFAPEVVVSDDSACTVQAGESFTMISVESNGAEECEITVKFNEQSVSHTVQFMDIAAE